MEGFVQTEHTTSVCLGMSFHSRWATAASWRSGIIQDASAQCVLVTQTTASRIRLQYASRRAMPGSGCHGSAQAECTILGGLVDLESDILDGGSLRCCSDAGFQERFICSSAVFPLMSGCAGGVILRVALSKEQNRKRSENEGCPNSCVGRFVSPTSLMAFAVIVFRNRR